MKPPVLSVRLMLAVTIVDVVIQRQLIAGTGDSQVNQRAMVLAPIVLAA